MRAISLIAYIGLDAIDFLLLDGVEVEPGGSATVYKAYGLQSASPVTVAVADRDHYARAIVFARTYTLGELAANTDAFLSAHSLAHDAPAAT